MYKDYEIKLNAILDKHKGVQKVELGVVDDLEDGLKWLEEDDKMIQKGLKSIKSEFSSLRKQVNFLKDTSQDSMQGVKQGEANIKSIEKQLKNLGMDSNAIPVIKKFKNAVSKAKENRKKVQSIPDIPKI
tara:strand:- start:855 stop:1244 length:390 start_codon:yes stop_codon:yes gene_type:complete